MFRSIWSRAILLIVLVAAEFAVIEAGLRFYGAFEGTTTFDTLFMDDAEVGLRLRPNARLRYTTVEFTTDIAINAQGVRDDEPVGPKPPNERRIVLLGDSLVLSVQVPFGETFGELLERRLNAAPGSPVTWRVINAGVQGYGPVDEWFLFDKVAAAFEPDVVLIASFVGNDAIEGADTADWLAAGRPIKPAQQSVVRLRRLVRSSVVMQSVRVRWDQLMSKVRTGTPERPLATYLVNPPPVIAEGLSVSREAYSKIAARAASIGAKTGIVLVPARFQTNDADFANLDAAVRGAGALLDRDSASRRFAEALAPLGLPMMDLQPILAQQSARSGLFYLRTVHFTPRGHAVAADAIHDFLLRSGLVAPVTPR